MAKTGKTKRLIYCPVCLKNGKINILGEITDDGFIIRRFHKGETIIQGSNFSVTCGLCHELIFFKKPVTGLNFWKYRFHWEEHRGTVGEKVPADNTEQR